MLLPSDIIISLPLILSSSVYQLKYLIQYHTYHFQSSQYILSTPCFNLCHVCLEWTLVYSYSHLHISPQSSTFTIEHIKTLNLKSWPLLNIIGHINSHVTAYTVYFTPIWLGPVPFVWSPEHMFSLSVLCFRTLAVRAAADQEEEEVEGYDGFIQLTAQRAMTTRPLKPSTPPQPLPLHTAQQNSIPLSERIPVAQLPAQRQIRALWPLLWIFQSVKDRPTISYLCRL